MGLSKKLRKTVEEIVYKYVAAELVSLAEHDNNQQQRLESLENEVSRLGKKVDGTTTIGYGPLGSTPGSADEGEYVLQRLPIDRGYSALGMNENTIASYVNGLYRQCPQDVVNVAIGALSDIHRLEHCLLESHDEEEIRSAGSVNAAIAYIRSLEEEDEENEAAAKTWSPAELIGRIPDRKLDNEVRARIVDGENRIDLTMIVRQNPVGKGYGSALPVIRVPSPYGSTLILVPADLPTEFTAKLFSRMLPAGYDPSGDPIQCKFMHNYVSFLVHFFDRDKVKWLPEQAEITFRMSDWLPVNGVVLGKGIPLRQVIEEYGEGAEPFAVLGSLFLEATFSPLPVPQPEAAPESPDAPPAAPRSP